MDFYLDIHEEVKITSGGNLPHWHQDEKVQFATFRLADSIPQTKISELNAVIASFKELNHEPWTDETKRRYRHLISKNQEQLLDNGYGSCILASKNIRAIVSDAIKAFDGVKYDLVAYVIMPNHVHMLFCPYKEFETSKILHSLKSYTSHAINAALNRSGSVWKRETYDRIVRNDDELKHYRSYILNNPKHLPSDHYELYWL